MCTCSVLITSYNACYVCTMYCQRMCKAMNVGTGSSTAAVDDREYEAVGEGEVRREGKSE